MMKLVESFLPVLFLLVLIVSYFLPPLGQVIFLIILVILSVIFMKTFAKLFDTPWCKALRFALFIAGITLFMVNYAKWQYEKNREIFKEQVSFELNIFDKSSNSDNDVSNLYAAENEIIWNPFCLYFSHGWQPVITEIDKFSNAESNFFNDNHGEKIDRDFLNRIFKPNSLTANVQGFYL